MRWRMSVSEARSSLSRILELQEDPELIVEITVNGLVAGELRVPEGDRFWVKPGKALLTALEHMGDPETSLPERSPTAREHDQYVYTRTRPDRDGA